MSVVKNLHSFDNLPESCLNHGLCFNLPAWQNRSEIHVILTHRRGMKRL